LRHVLTRIYRTQCARGLIKTTLNQCKNMHKTVTLIMNVNNVYN